MEKEHTFWTTEKIENIKTLALQGKTPTEISNITNIDRKRIERLCKKNNIDIIKGKIYLGNEQKTLIEELIKKGYLLKDICNVLQLKERTITNFCTKNKLYINVRSDTDNWSEEDVQNLKNMNSQAMTVRDMARILRKRTDNVKNKLISLGIANQLIVKNLINKTLKNTNKRHCWKCDTTKNIEDFYINGDNRNKHCKACLIEASKTKRLLLYNDDYKALLYKRFHDSKLRARKIKKEFTISLKDLYEIYEKQNALCFYTKKPLKGFINDPMSISIDRKDSSKGYTSDNIVLCGKVINSMKSDLSVEDFKNIVLSLYNNICLL